MNTSNILVTGLTALTLALAGSPAAANKGAHPYDTVRIGPGDLVDSATTAWGLNAGFVEGNPVFAPLGDSVPLVGLAAKYGFKKLSVHLGMTPAQANTNVESVGLGAGCANVVTITGGEPHMTVAAFAVCMFASRSHMKKRYARETGLNLDGTPYAGRPVKGSVIAHTGATGAIDPAIYIDPRDGKSWRIKNGTSAQFTTAQKQAVIDRMKSENARLHDGAKNDDEVISRIVTPKVRVPAKLPKGDQIAPLAHPRGEKGPAPKSVLFTDARSGKTWTVTANGPGSLDPARIRAAIDKAEARR